MTVLGVWTPSSPAPALFPRRWERALKAAEEHGFRTRLGATVPGCVRAGAAEPRALADDLHALVAGGEVDAVIAAAGGWTAALVLPYLDMELLRRAGVPLIGYSDVSVLLWALYRNGVPALHGPTLIAEFGHAGGPLPETVESLRRALAGRGGALCRPAAWTDANPWWDRDDNDPLPMRPTTPWRVLRAGVARGPLLAGCLPAVSGLFGTPYLPDAAGHILFLEDFGMAPDRFLALLAQWRNSGQLDAIAGLVLGRRARPGAAPGGYADFDDAVLHVLGDRDVPVVADVDFGHTEPHLTLPLGAPVLLTTDPLLIHVEEAPADAR
jgi:muramoyltetrapeptide carboxypeptidase